MLDVWIVQIYVPKTSRCLLGYLNLIDLSELYNRQEVFRTFSLETKNLTPYFHNIADLEYKLRGRNSMQLSGSISFTGLISKIHYENVRKSKKFRGLVLKYQSEQEQERQQIKLEKTELFERLKYLFEFTRQCSN